MPAAENAYAGAYPPAGFLTFAVNRAPGKPPDPLIREFLVMVCSKEGQAVVFKEGYFPIPAAIAREELQMIR